MSKKKKRRLYDAEPITFRTLTVCFSERTVTIDGKIIKAESDCLAIPILSTDSPIYFRGAAERIA